MAVLSEITIMTETLIGLRDAFASDSNLEDNADDELTAKRNQTSAHPINRQGSWGGIDASYGSTDDEEPGLAEQEPRWNRYSGAGADFYEPSLGSTQSMNQIH